MKTIDEIKQKCREKGLNIYHVLKEARVSKDIVYRWDKKEPSSLDSKRKIDEAIEKLSDEIHSGTKV